MPGAIQDRTATGQTGSGAGVRPRAQPQCFDYCWEGKAGSTCSFPLASPRSLRDTVHDGLTPARWLSVFLLLMDTPRW